MKDLEILSKKWGGGRKISREQQHLHLCLLFPKAHSI